MEFESSQFIEIFMEEAEEQLQGMTDSLLLLEENPSSSEALNELFRLAHTLKGSAAMVGFHHISSFAHRMEDVLDRLREGSLVSSSNVVDVFLRCLDTLKGMMASLGDSTTEGRKNEIHVEAEQLKVCLEQLKEGKPVAAKKPVSTPEPDPAGDPNPLVPTIRLQLGEKEISALHEHRDIGQHLYEIHIFMETDAQMGSIRGFLVCSALQTLGEIISVQPNVMDEGFSGDVKEVAILLAIPDARPDEIENRCHVDEVRGATVVEVNDIDVYVQSRTAEAQASAVIGLQEPVHSEGEPGDGTSVGVRAPGDHKEDRSASRTVRVDIEKLDTLLNLAGELVINRGRAMELAATLATQQGESQLASDLLENILAQGRIVSQLQEAVMSARMIPIGVVFSRFKRVIRDLARDRGRKVDLVIRGEETELDKKIIDMIGEPLTHMVRNAVDHGIEPPEERLAAGKSETGTVTFDAYHEGNNIRVEVMDDGKGVNLVRVREKCLENGVYTQEEMEGMNEKQLLQALFLPGFSTAKEISSVSGRGVGLDVVKRKIEELGGTVELQTEAGKGSRFVMKLPLTLAIIQALLVEVNQETYALPISSVAETIRITPDDVFTIEQRGEVIRLREKVVPILRLNEVLGHSQGTHNEGRLYIAVVGDGDKEVGLVVDRMVSEQEIVIKSMAGNFPKADYLAGASILGNGDVSLILDTSVLVNSSLH